ncbi:MAG: hypothetical protein Q9169_002040 [Polycauliona sp. 2 TL-2023]
METERTKREPRRLEHSFQADPQDPVPLDASNTIARSKSRYKGNRPNIKQRSISTPSTFDSFRGPLVKEHGHHDTFTPLSRKTSDLPSPQNASSRPEAVQLSRQEYHNQASSHRKTKSTELQGIAPVRARKDLSRTHHDGVRHAKADRENAPRDASTIRQDVRRAALPVRTAMVQKKSFSERIAGLMSQPQSTAEAKEQLKSIISNPIAIDPENQPSPPNFDAPKSAVNAGERTVRVKYKEFQVPVTVVPSTTPADIIRSVSNKVSIAIDPDSSVMLESFKQLGLERPLRTYEHIRDVLNSWDDDSQHALIIEQSSHVGQDDDLDVKHVTKKQPDDSTFYLYHSRRPGHWDKRVVMVRSDGQMLLAKSNGGEFSNICHLSDFDIYIPTAREVAKNIRPPKRICFAVKSQQKSNMFLSTVNFVHFFASNDKRIAMAFYAAVQGWRSWYLVNMMGKGASKSSQPIGGGPGRVTATVKVETRPADPIRVPRKHSEAQRDLPSPSKPSPKAGLCPALQKAQHPAPQNVHPAYRNKADDDRNDRQFPPPAPIEPSSTGTTTTSPFTGGGLLGRTYTQRKKAQQDHEPRHSGTAIQMSTSLSSPVKADVNGLKRTSSQRQKPKPLIDLTPVYQEPIQHSRKGKGVTPGHIPAGGLVDIATSPEVAILIPPKSDWRKPSIGGSGADALPTRGAPY